MTSWLTAEKRREKRTRRSRRAPRVEKVREVQKRLYVSGQNVHFFVTFRTKLAFCLKYFPHPGRSGLVWESTGYR